MASNSDSDPVVTYGVLGCANIARKVIKAIHYSKNSKLIAIASRDINKANKYCTDNNIPDDVIKYGSYADLLKNRDVHVVYVPLPTTQHCQWVIQAANAGKHILVEKPVAVNHREFEEMVNACNKNNVFIMDGTMFMHHDRLNVLKQYLSNHNPKFNCGTIKRINSSFSFPGDASFHESNIRVNADADPLGALGDLGWYSIRLGIVAYSASVGTAESQAPYSILKPHSCRCVCTTWSPDGVCV